MVEREPGGATTSTLRDVFTELFGPAPSRPPAECITVNCIVTPLGEVLAAADEATLYLLEFADRRSLQTQIDRLRKRRLQLVSMDRPGKGQESDSTWEFPSDERGPYGDLRNQERGEAISEAVRALPWEYRELIVMRHYGELSYGEIAEAKDMPLGTVKNKLFRARQMLKEKLAEFLVD